MIEFEILSGSLDEDEHTALAQVLDAAYQRPRGRVAQSGPQNLWGPRGENRVGQRVFNPGAFRTVSYF